MKIVEMKHKKEKGTTTTVEMLLTHLEKIKKLIVEEKITNFATTGLDRRTGDMFVFTSPNSTLLETLGMLKLAEENILASFMEEESENIS